MFQDLFQDLILCFLCILVCASAAMAQDTAPPGTPKADVQGTPGRSLDPGTCELGIWTGYSSDNPTLMGRTTNRPFFEIGIQYARVLRTDDNWALKYIADIIPVAIIKQPRQGYAGNGNHREPVDLPGSKQKIYGAGVTPIGLR
jgi:hypothetical protein